MYEELVNQLRELPHLLFVQLHGHEDVVYKAADAIEELSKGSEKVVMDYCKKRNLVLITMESFETLKAYYNRSNGL